MLEDIYSKTKENMEKSITHLTEDFKTVRSGKASPSMIENISIDYYGNKTPLKQMATITSPESKLIVIQPWDKSALESIEKTLQKTDLGVNPMNDGSFIRLAFPPLSEEQRGNLAKIVHTKGEDSKVAIRNIRRDCIHDIDKDIKDSNLSEDSAEQGKKEIQKFTDDYINKIDKMTTAKASEIMEV